MICCDMLCCIVLYCCVPSTVSMVHRFEPFLRAIRRAKAGEADPPEPPDGTSGDLTRSDMLCHSFESLCVNPRFACRVYLHPCAILNPSVCLFWLSMPSSALVLTVPAFLAVSDPCAWFSDCRLEMRSWHSTHQRVSGIQLRSLVYLRLPTLYTTLLYSPAMMRSRPYGHNTCAQNFLHLSNHSRTDKRPDGSPKSVRVSPHLLLQHNSVSVSSS